MTKHPQALSLEMTSLPFPYDPEASDISLHFCSLQCSLLSSPAHTSHRNRGGSKLGARPRVQPGLVTPPVWPWPGIQLLQALLPHLQIGGDMGASIYWWQHKGQMHDSDAISEYLRDFFFSSFLFDPQG